MSKTATLEGLRQQVMNRKRLLTDEVVSVKSLLMDPAQPGRMIVRRPGSNTEASYAFDDRVYSQAPGVVYGLPGSYLKKLLEGDKGDPSLAALNFNHWVGVSSPKEVLLRFREDPASGEKIVRAIKPAGWNAIPYESSIDTLITKFGPDKQVEVTRFDENMMVLDFIARKLEIQTIPGKHDIGRRDDPFEWGMRFQDSDVGQGDLMICPYTRRLICSNGATTTTRGVIMNISHSGKQSAVLEEVQSNVRQGIEMIDGYAGRVSEQIVAAHGIELEVNPDNGQPESALVRLAKDCGITRLQDKYVREAWLVEGETIPENSVYRLHNAVTRAGTHAEELEDDAKLALQSVGGRILELATTNYHWN